MTVTSSILDFSYDCDGVTVDFPVPFYFLADADLWVQLADADPSSTNPPTTLVLGVDYTVSGAGNEGGGNVHTNTAYPSTKRIVGERLVPVTQLTAYQQNDPFPAKVTERAFDKLTMICQQISRIIGGGFNSLSRILMLGPADVNGSGAYRANSNRIQDLRDPILDQDAATKSYVDAGDDASKAYADGLVASITVPTYQAFMPTVFQAGPDFTPGVTTALPLPESEGPKVIAGVFFDGTFQDPTQWDNPTVDVITFGGPIPVGVTTVTVQYFAPALLGNFQQNGIGAVTRTLQSKMRDRVDVRDFGARGDGTTDDTIAINRAEAYLNSIGGGILWFGPGVFRVSSVTKRSDTIWQGCGIGVTVIKQLDGTHVNATVAGLNAYDLFGGNAVAGIVNWSLRDLTIDGNRQGGATGDCLGVYGWAHILMNVELKSASGNGWHNEFGDPGIEEHQNVQSWAQTMYIWDCNQNGLYFGGPNDSNFTGLNVYWNLFAHIHLWGRGTGKFTDCHVWSDQEGGRQAFVGIRVDSPLNTFTSCVAEGSSDRQVWVRSDQNTFIGGEYFYNQNIGNLVSGFVLGDSLGQGGAVVAVHGNRIITRANNLNKGAVIFDFDGGGNFIDIIGNNASSSSSGYVGAPGAGSRIRIHIIGAGSNSIANTEANAYAVSGLVTLSGGLQLTGLGGGGTGLVSLGPVDSAGSGFRTVRVPN